MVKRFLFRVDSSIAIGSGHVMRCLTLARALLARGYKSLFVCREHAGNLIHFVKQQGFEVYSIPMGFHHDSNLPYADWLGASLDEDINVSRSAVKYFEPTWIVVDHYALDQAWEEAVRPVGCRLLVIDDLADRSHLCDVLLDQNLGRCSSSYRNLVPVSCKILAGPVNALLRPEFKELRNFSNLRRKATSVKEVLVTLGGVDQCDYTGQILEALKLCDIPNTYSFTVVMGEVAPHLETVKKVASTCPWEIQVVSGVSNLAQRMANSDLAIGAAGGTSWERCCLGLPTILVIMAENQRPSGLALKSAGAVHLIDLAFPLQEQLQSSFTLMDNQDFLQSMSQSAANVCDGLGVERVLSAMELDD